MAQTRQGRREPWSDAVRSRARELARDRELSAPEVREAIREELGQTVPHSTVVRWVREVRRSEPIDRPAVIRDVADRATLLLSEEIGKQERLTPGRRDVNRIDQIAKTLKTLASIETAKAGPARQTLADLSGGAQTAEAEERPERRAA